MDRAQYRAGMHEGHSWNEGVQGKRELCFLASLCCRLSLKGELLPGTAHFVSAVPGERCHKKLW